MYIQGFLTDSAATKIGKGRTQHTLKWMQIKIRKNKKQCAPGLSNKRRYENTFSWPFFHGSQMKV